MGVASVGAAARDGPAYDGLGGAGLLAGAVLALTPVAVLMFRFNNPDALLVLLLVGVGVRHPARRSSSASTATRSAGSRSAARWSGSRSSPRCCRRSWCCRPSALVYLLVRAHPAGASGSATCWSRSARCSLAGGWWIAIVVAVAGARAARTSAARRTTRSSSSPSATTASAGSPATRPARSAAAAAAAACGARPACCRLFNCEIGGQIAWLLPGRAGARRRPALWFARRRRAPTCVRPASSLWGGWLLVTGADLQLHGRHLPRLLHRRPGPGDRRARRHRRLACSGSTATSLRRRGRRWPSHGRRSPRCSAFVLLGRTADFLPWLRWVVAGRRPGRRARCWPASATCPAGSRVAVAAAALVAGAGRARRRTPSSTAATAAHRLDPERRPGGHRSGGLGGGPGGWRRRPRRAGRHAAGGRRRRPAACSTAARRPAAITALLQRGRRRLHLGRGRGRLQQRRPATSSPARSR